MAIDQLGWEPESPFTELEEGEQLLAEPAGGFGEEEIARPLVAGLRAAPAQPSGRVYVQITGQKQGNIAGNPGAAGHQGWLSAGGFEYGLKAPRDVATGQASGKRQHSAVTVSAPLGPASPLLFQALVTNERLPKVVFEFAATTADGSETVAQRITLVDAGLTEFHRLGGVDQLSFSFRQITFEDLLGRTTARDSWGGLEKELDEAESWEAETYEVDGAGMSRSGADGFA